MLALVDHLQAQGLDIGYDQVVLHVGDSLIRTISTQIAEGDFLIAVVSPDSLTSEWCQKELALAMTEGIGQRRVKVLPIKYRGAAMPPMLGDAYYADADAFDPETLARKLGAAMTAQEGREAEAAEAAANAGGTPAHAEVKGDVTVAQFDGMAQKVIELLGVWTDVYGGVANLRDIEQGQRQLRWEVEKLPRRAGDGLPLITQLANAQDIYFAREEPAAVEPDIFEELRSVRTQLAQGLPVTRRWFIDIYIGVVPTPRDATAFQWRIRRGDESRSVCVYISGTAMASADDHLPREVVEAKTTTGRIVITSLLALDEPPEEVMVSTAGVSLTMPN